MPPTENQNSFLNRISIRRNMAEDNHDGEHEGLELFQKHVAEYFSDLVPIKSTTSSASASAAAAAAAAATATTDAASSNPEDSPAPQLPPKLLSISWFRKLLDAFLCCEAEFKAVVVMGRDPAQFHKPPLDRLIPELLDRAVKALDICNAVTNAIELVRHWDKLAQVVVSCLEQRPVGEGQVKRAKKALNTLLMSMTCDDKENGHHSKNTERSWSFGRRGSTANKDRTGGTFRSLSWSIAKSWSAAKQIQVMTSNLVVPRGEQTGLALPVYIMSTVLVFVMWALVAALPCQERNGLEKHWPVPKQLAWAQPLTTLHEKIVEEWKKKEKKGTAGVLEETQKLEKLGHSLVDFTEAFEFPVNEEKVKEITVQITELAEICRKMKEGLVPLQQQVREVFHRIVRSRTEILDAVDQCGKMTLSPVQY